MMASGHSDHPCRVSLELFLVTVFVVAWASLECAEGALRWSSNGPSRAEVRALVVDPSDPHTVYAGTATAVFRSADRGGHWHAAGTGLEGDNLSILIANPSPPFSLYAVTEQGLFRTDDRGLNWFPVTDSLAETPPLVLAMDPADPKRMFAIIGAGVHLSTDGGLRWKPINAGLAYTEGIYALVLDPADADTIYIGTFPYSFSYGETAGGGVFRTANAGQLWTAANTGLGSRKILSFTVDSTNTEVLYAGTLETGVWKSTDAGDSWSAANTGIEHAAVNAIVIDPVTPRIIYAIVRDRTVYRSTDGGGYWSEVGEGLSGTTVSALIVSPGPPVTVYAGTDAGVFSLSGTDMLSGAAPIPSQRVYSSGNRVYVTLPDLPQGIEQYLGVVMPDGTFFSLTHTNTAWAFDRSTLPRWEDGDVVLDFLLGALVGVYLPVGQYTVYLLRVPVGANPLADFDIGELGASTFTIE